MRILKTLLALLMVGGLIGGLMGCGSDENPATPQGDTLTLDSTTAEDFTLQALDVVNNMINEIPDFAAGEFDSWAQSKADFAKVNTDTVTWDPAQNAWVFTYEGPLFEMEPPNHWDVSLDLWVQYRNATGPLQSPLGATAMEVRYGTGMDMHMVEGQESADLDYDMNTHMVVSYLGEGGAYAVVGSGDTVMDVAQVSPEGSQSGRFSMDWTMDVSVSDYGCASGTATVNAQGWQLAATYDGQGNVNWQLNGPNYQATGTDVMDCSQPMH
jgi:hypothetical protein